DARLTWSMAEGGTVNVSAITTTPHLGSHADAPFHTEPRGETMADLPLERYLGPCRVARVPPQPLIEPRHLEGIDLSNPPRLLLKTESVRDRRTFPERFSALSPELAALLGERRVLLVGLDTPSVDPFDSKTLDAHHALAHGGVAILEGLVLDGVPEGIYELIALPLKLAGLDASPVRAVLRTLES
ncbi:MAG: cyclase family protein, partial [Thermoanaerobaculia bacterium]